MPQFRSIIEITAVLLFAVLSIAAIQAPVQPEVPISQDADILIAESDKPKAETLSYIVQAGEVLIFNLPELLGGKKISEYKIKRAPALSWLVKRSFFWRTLAKDQGKHEVLLNAMVNGSSVESVVVEIEIR
ncbi:MAG: hypothetical protein AB8G77_04475 [Rhodothermales bacterium]